MFATTITPTSINIVANGKVYTVDKSHMNYQSIRDTLKRLSDYTLGNTHRTVLEQKIVELADIKKFIAKATFGAVQIGDEAVLFNGQEVKGVISQRLISFVQEGFSPRPLALFLEKLQSNPQKHAREELYLWLETSNLPICDDGDFLAFKKVRDDYTSLHDSVTRNDIGTLLEMPREHVDPARDNTCSRGYHFCSLNYLGTMGSGRTVICKINPADVVTIPSDYSNQKGRAWRYLIIDEVKEDQKPEDYHADTPVVQAEVGMVGVGMSDKYMYVEDADDASYDADDDYDVSYDDDEAIPFDVPPVTLSATEKDRIKTWGLDATGGLSAQAETIATLLAGTKNPDVLGHSFPWADTPQGADFWRAEAHKARLSIDARCILQSWINYLAELRSPNNWEWTNSDTVKVVEHEVLEHHGTTYLISDLKALLKEHGQRGTARLTGIPRTTLQDWTTKYNLA